MKETQAKESKISFIKWVSSKDDGHYLPYWDEQIISKWNLMPYTWYINNLIDEMSSFRDKYLKEYRVKNTNISILKKAK